MINRALCGLTLVLGLAGCGETGPPAHLSIPGTDPENGRALIVRYDCGTCHFVEGIPGADGIVGPRLENFSNRALIAGRFPNVPSNIVPWLMNPPALKPDTAMPNLGISDMQARDIASYLYSLGAAQVPPRPDATLPDPRPADAQAPAQRGLVHDGDSGAVGPDPASLERAIKQLAEEAEP